jgi:hypothetical protein
LEAATRHCFSAFKVAEPLPAQFACGQPNQQSVGTVVIEPARHLLVETHLEAAASGEASSTKKRDSPSACSMEGHRWGVAERLVSSRNTRSARRLYQGLPRFCTADCGAAAMGLSLAGLYEMKAS